jgi:hypothetical protein
MTWKPREKIISIKFTKLLAFKGKVNRRIEFSRDINNSNVISDNSDSSKNKILMHKQRLLLIVKTDNIICGFPKCQVIH